jgi:acyl-CoA thioesterase FadM
VFVVLSADSEVLYADTDEVQPVALVNYLVLFAECLVTLHTAVRFDEEDSC